MKSHAQKQSQPPQPAAPHFTGKNATSRMADRAAHPIVSLQHAIGDQASKRSLTQSAEGLAADSAPSEAACFAHDFSQIPVFFRTSGRLQTKLTVNTPGDVYEQEADRVAEQVMSMPEPQARHMTNQLAQTKTLQANDAGKIEAPPLVDEVLHSTGQPLDSSTRTFMEPRFGHDFAQVRLHTDTTASQSAAALNARAYTAGSDVVFGRGEYSPQSHAGRTLLAHELAHVVQKRHNTIQKDDDRQAGEKNDSKAKLIQKIKSDFGIKDVLDIDASFNAKELGIIIGAFTKIPAADIVSIKGAVLKRVKNAGPTVVAYFQSNQQYTAQQLIDEQSILIADEAFTALAEPEAVRSIVHEIGHAVSKIEVINKTREAYKAGFDSNLAINKVLEKKKELDGLPPGTDQKAKTQLGDEITALRADRDAKMKDSAAKDTAMKAAYANMDDVRASVDEKNTSMATEESKVTDILNGSDSNSAAYRADINTVKNKLEELYKECVSADADSKKVETLRTTVGAAVLNRDKSKAALAKRDAKNPALTSLQALGVAQDVFFRATVFLAMNRQMPKPVRKFYDFVVRNSILPTDSFSPYAAREWPNKPGEYYAESYSFYLAAPKKLETFSKPLFDWFKAGNYR